MSKRYFSRREDKINFLSPSSGHLMFCLFGLLKWTKYSHGNTFACEDKAHIFKAHWKSSSAFERTLKNINTLTISTFCTSHFTLEIFSVN